MLAASSWWLPSSAIRPPPVRSQSRQRISSSSGGSLVLAAVELLGLVAEALGAEPSVVFELLLMLRESLFALLASRPRLVPSRHRPLLLRSGDVLGELFEAFVRARQRRLPAVVAGQVAAVPLGADVVQIAEQAVLDRVRRRCRTGCCSAAGDRWPDRLPRLPAATRPISLHWATLWAISFSVSTCLPLRMARDGRLGVQVQRQGDDHGLDVRCRRATRRSLLVDLDVLLGLVLASSSRTCSSGPGGRPGRCRWSSRRGTRGGCCTGGCRQWPRTGRSSGVWAPMSTLPSSPVPMMPTRTGFSTLLP